MLLWTTNLGFRVRESNFMKNPLLVLISLSFSGISSAVQYNGLRLAFALSLLLILHTLMPQTVIKAAFRVWRKKCISTTWSRYLPSSWSCQSQSILLEFRKMRCRLESSTMPISRWNRGWMQKWKQYQILAAITCHTQISFVKNGWCKIWVFPYRGFRNCLIWFDDFTDSPDWDYHLAQI